MRVIVTGALGLLGRSVTAMLADEGHWVIGYDRLAPVEARRDLVRLDLSGISGDFRWPDGTDVVLHLAGVWDPPVPSGAGLQHQIQANVEAVARSVSACNGRTRRFVYVSSMSVYGRANTVPSREEETPFPDNWYGRTKWLGEQACRLAGETYPDLDIVILRLAQVYGPGTPIRTLMYQLIDQAVTRGCIEMRCSPTMMRDHIHLSDATRALVLAATVSFPPGVYNVGCGGHTVAHLGQCIAGACSQPIRLEFGCEPGQDKAIDPSKFISETAFNPVIPLCDGVADEVGKYIAMKSGVPV